MNGRSGSIARGLALRVDNQAMIQNELALHDRAVQAEAQKQKQNWMLTGDIEFGRAFDPYNKNRLEKYTNDTLKQIGKLVSSGDIMNDPERLSKLQQLKRSLVDNEIVDESIQYMAQKQFMNQFMNDPRNKEFLDEPEIIQAIQQSQMYESTGSIDGDQFERKQFQFRPPPVKINTADIIATHYSKLQRHSVAPWGKGHGGFRQFVSAQDMSEAATNLWEDDSLAGKSIRREWQEMNEEQKAVYANNPINWIKSRGKAYAPQDTYNPGRFFSPNSRGGSGSGGAERVDFFQRNIYAPLLNGLINGQANPQMYNNQLIGTMVGPNGQYRANKSRVYDANGNGIQLDLGTRFGVQETGGVRMRTAVDPNTGQLVPQPGGMEMEMLVPMSVNELRQHEGDLFDFFDGSFWNWINPLADYDEANDFEIEPQYQGIIQKANKEAADGSHLLYLHIWQPVSSDIPEIYNNSLGLKEKGGVGFGGGRGGTPMFQPGSTVEVDGETFEIGPDGKPIL